MDEDDNGKFRPERVKMKMLLQNGEDLTALQSQKAVTAYLLLFLMVVFFVLMEHIIILPYIMYV